MSNYFPFHFQDFKEFEKRLEGISDFTTIPKFPILFGTFMKAIPGRNPHEGEKGNFGRAMLDERSFHQFRIFG